MTLFEIALQNESLVFIDDSNGVEYTLKNLPQVNFKAKSKSLVFLYLSNSIKNIGAFWSLMRGEHCIALLSIDLTPSFKHQLEQLYKPDYIIDFSRTFVEHYNYHSPDSYLSFFESKFKNSKNINNNIKLLISTSGSTGSPKFVKLSETNIIENARSICDYLPINTKDVTPLNLPIYYSYGLSVLTSNSLEGGKIVCTNEDVLKKEFWLNFEKYGYTSIAGVPFVYEMLDRIGFTKKNYPTLRYLTQAGGKLQDILVKKYAEYSKENKIDFFVMYGQTEATARMSYLPPDKTLDKLGSIGKPIKNGIFSIDSQTNELCYEGPNVFGGYVTHPDELTTYENNLLLHTGDLAKIDNDGYYYIIGRAKRFVKIFGSRINLDEVESILSKKFEINAKCIGLNDKSILIFILNNERYNVEQITQFLSIEIKIHITAIKLKEVNDFPLTANGKIDYTKLTKSYETA